MSAATLLAAIGILLLAAMYARQSQAIRRERAHFLDDCLELFSNYRVIQDRLHYATLAGSYRGAAVRLEPIVDTLAWRKLPSLWLKVSLFTPLPLEGAVGFLVRPNGSEFFSPTADLAFRSPAPRGWPEGALFASDSPPASALLGALSQHVPTLFSDPRMKEIVVTPNGLRFVYQADEAVRAHYVVLREIRFAKKHLDRATAKRLLDAAHSLAHSIVEEVPCRVAAA